MTDFNTLFSQFAELLAAPDLNARRAEFASSVAQLGEALAQHERDLRGLDRRVEQLEIGLVYTDRGCGA